MQKNLLRPMKYPLQQLDVGCWPVVPQFQNEIVDSRFRQKDVLRSGRGDQLGKNRIPLTVSEQRDH